MIFQYFSIPLSEIKRQIENLEIDDSLDFQRDFVWSVTKQKDLLASYRNRKGFGRISFCRTATNGIWGILDGKQRATTFIRFMNGEFKDHDGKYFAEWTEGDRARLELHPVQITGHTLESTEDYSDLVEQFVLLNNSGQKLIDAELIHACSAPAVRKANEFFHSPLGTVGINVVEERLREKWCETFRSPEHFTKKLAKKDLKQVCVNHGLDKSGKKSDLIELIEGNPEALMEMRDLLSNLNDGRIPVSEQKRKNQYAITVPMIASACLNDFGAITGSFNKLKKSGAFNDSVLSEDGVSLFHNCLNHWLDWVEIQRNIVMPDKYKMNHPQFGIPQIMKASVGWAICLVSLGSDGEEQSSEKSTLFRTQCSNLFDDGNFKPLNRFYSKLSADDRRLSALFELAQQASRGSTKQFITNSVAFICKHCDE